MSWHSQEYVRRAECDNSLRAVKYAAFLREYADQNYYETVWVWTLTDMLDDVARVAAGEPADMFTESEWNT
jgi:hypothetical protein